jgi:galactose mutarotase-like enzyme
MTTAMETVQLRDAGASVWLAPARGGMVTRFEVDGRPVLYLDEATLLDATKNVRGGNPVLFPSPGPLPGDRFTWRGRSGAMKQHGFARNRPWRVVATTENEAVLELASDDVTRGEYPWDFVLRFRHVLAGARLRIEQRIANTGKEPMPFAAGFHPYFHVADADKPRTRIPTGATRAFDNVTKSDVDVRGPIDLAQKEVDLHLADHRAGEATLERADGSRVIVRAHPDYRRWVIWTLAGKDFVCLEPWTAGGGALAREDDVLVVAPGEARDLFMEIELA